MLPNELISDIEKRADIVSIIARYLPLQKKGRDYVAKCPFHDDHSPSMHISPEKRMFKCFVCGTGGSVFKFVQLIENINFEDAVRKVAEFIDYHDDRLNKKATYVKKDDEKAPLYDCLKDLTTFYQYCLNTEEGKVGLAYLENRHLDYDIRQQFQIGYAPKDGFTTVKLLTAKGHNLQTIEECGISKLQGNEYADKNQGRVIFPIWNKDGEIIGYSARRIIDNDNEPKYVNTQETKVFHKSSVLYNYHNVRKYTQLEKYVYVVEGFMDVIALYKAGIKSAVGLMGVAFTSEHLALLRSLNVEIRLCLDGDQAGQDHTFTAAQELSKNNIPFRVVNALGYKKDSDEILNELGADGLKKYLNNLMSFNDYIISYFTHYKQLTTNEGKKRVIMMMLPLLTSLHDQIEKDDYIAKLSKITGFDAVAIRNLVIRSRNKTQKERADIIKQFHPERKENIKLYRTEKCLLMFMLTDISAIEIYKQRIVHFYDEILRNLAEIIVNYYDEKHKLVPSNEIMILIENSKYSNKDEMSKEIMDLSEGVMLKYSQEILEGLIATIEKEKEKINRKDRISNSMKGSEDRQIDIIDSLIREKRKKFWRKTDGEKN